MMDIPSGSIKVTKNSDGTGTIVISTGQLIYASGAPAGVLGGTETLVYAFKLTTSQCTTVATRLAQAAIGGAGAAGSDVLLVPATTAETIGLGTGYHGRS